MSVDVHWVAAVAFGFELTAVAGVEAEQQCPAGPLYAVELGEDRGYVVVGEVDQTEPGQRAGQRLVG